ncbi:hypothetical protein Q428_03730 [Fervidicella metallireducens AeB]|uniref:Uncharacterized protein n=1 Tax=Fervidicella metallireducens AeB TaxID=1403537 RepID=A0A017RX37_9CLOT|nr:hypothetical protein [Fervidicella metallireducens]EYE89252.1 hypothetical protein Q428_03730 [Fervidicella metallireducens AeB]
MSLERYLNDLDKNEELEAGLLFELEETAPDELHNEIIDRMINEHTLHKKQKLNHKFLTGLAAAILIFVGARSIYLPFHNLKKSEETGYLKDKKELSKNIMEDRGVAKQAPGVTQYSLSNENTTTDKNMSSANITNDRLETTKKNISQATEKSLAEKTNDVKLQQERKEKDTSEKNYSYDKKEKTQVTDFKNNDINDEVLNNNSNKTSSDFSDKSYVVNYQLYINDEEEEKVRLILAGSTKLSDNIFSLTEEDFKNFLEEVNRDNIQLEMLNEVKEDKVVIEILKKQP